MVARIIALLAVTLFLASGCTDLTEFKGTVAAGIHVISPSSFTVVQTLTGIEAGRSICATDSGIFLVATTDGTLLRYNASTLEKTGTFIVDQPYSAGFFEMAHSPTENSVYLIGALGKIIEIDIPDCEVLDEFNVCSNPKGLLVGNGRPYLYITDANSEAIFEIHLISNTWSRICYLKSVPVCMAAAQNQDTILVGTLDGIDLLTTHGTGTIIRRTYQLTPPVSSIVTIPENTVLCAVMNFQSGDEVTSITEYWPSGVGTIGIWRGETPLEGENHCICASRDGIHAYVLSYTGGSVSRLVSYNVETYSIDDELDLHGYPMDLVVLEDGRILALTTE